MKPLTYLKVFMLCLVSLFLCITVIIGLQFLANKSNAQHEIVIPKTILPGITLPDPDDIELMGNCLIIARDLVKKSGYDPTHFVVKPLTIDIAICLFNSAKKGN